MGVLLKRVGLPSYVTNNNYMYVLNNLIMTAKRELMEFILLTMMGGVMIFTLYIMMMLENINK